MLTRVTSNPSANLRAASFMGTPEKSPWTSPGTRSPWSSWALTAHSPERLSCADAEPAASASSSEPPSTRARKVGVTLRRLIEGFAGTPAPVEAVGVALQVLHPQAMVGRVAARVADDRNRVADVERLVRQALIAELRGAAPLDGPALELTLVVRRLDVHERMGV